MSVEHALAYLAKSWLIRADKRGDSLEALQEQESRSIVTGNRTHSVARAMAKLLYPEALGVLSTNVVSKEDGHSLAKTCYRCECCGELTFCSEEEWENADIMLELGARSGLLAAHVTCEGIEWWLEQTGLSEQEHYNLGGLLAPGVRIISMQQLKTKGVM